MLKERPEYRKRQDRDTFNTDSCCSITRDGADQSAFGIPGFVAEARATRGKAIDTYGNLKANGIYIHRPKSMRLALIILSKHCTYLSPIALPVVSFHLHFISIRIMLQEKTREQSFCVCRMSCGTACLPGY